MKFLVFSKPPGGCAKHSAATAPLTLILTVNLPSGSCLLAPFDR